MKIDSILNSENSLTKDEIIFLLDINDEDDLQRLFMRAAEIKRKYCSDEIQIAGVIVFSNYCKENCLYCGLRSGNISVKRYRMTAEEIISSAQQLTNIGIKTIVLESGEDDYYDRDFISHIIYSLKQSADISISLCIGERGFDEYRAWKMAGADQYILKHESANIDNYSVYHLKQNLTDRINHLRYLKKIGYQIGSGNIIGLPLQSVKDIADDILLLKNLNVDTAIIHPFIPSPFTPYQKRNPGSINLSLKALAVARLVLKNANLPITSAVESIDPEGREISLYAGANSIMSDFTPPVYKEYCKAYPERYSTEEETGAIKKVLITRDNSK